MSSHIQLCIVLKEDGVVLKKYRKNTIFPIVSLVFALFTLKFLVRFLL